jgi:hypothetical protein
LGESGELEFSLCVSRETPLFSSYPWVGE